MDLTKKGKNKKTSLVQAKATTIPAETTDLTKEDENEIDANNNNDDNEDDDRSNAVEISSEFLGPIEIPLNFETRDEVKDMIQSLLLDPTRTKTKKLSSILFSFVCCLTVDAVLKDKKAYTEESVSNEFDRIMKSLPSNPLYRNRLFTHFPGHSFPPQFIEFIEILQGKRGNKSDDSVVAQQEKDTSENDLNLTGKFGSTVLSNASATKSFIHHSLLSYWKDPSEFKKGESLSGLLFAIRKSLWPQYCATLSDDAARQEISKKQKKMQGLKFTAEEREQIKAEKREKAMKKPFTSDWYPKEWLSFVLLSLPAAEGRIDYLSIFGSYSMKPESSSSNTPNKLVKTFATMPLVTDVDSVSDVSSLKSTSLGKRNRKVEPVDTKTLGEEDRQLQKRRVERSSLNEENRQLQKRFVEISPQNEEDRQLQKQRIEIEKKRLEIEERRLVLEEKGFLRIKKQELLEAITYFENEAVKLNNRTDKQAEIAEIRAKIARYKGLLRKTWDEIFKVSQFEKDSN